jgi:segregation and condensation protein A
VTPLGELTVRWTGEDHDDFEIEEFEGAPEPAPEPSAEPSDDTPTEEPQS